MNPVNLEQKLMRHVKCITKLVKVNFKEPRENNFKSYSMYNGMYNGM